MQTILIVFFKFLNKTMYKIKSKKINFLPSPYLKLKSRVHLISSHFDLFV